MKRAIILALKIFGYICILIIPLIFFQNCTQPDSFSEGEIKLPSSGIYDGIIGNQKIILSVEKADSMYASGFYIFHRNKAFESKFLFELTTTESGIYFKSDVEKGKIRGIGDSTGIDGGLLVNTSKSWYKFIVKGKTFQLRKRKGVNYSYTERYVKPQFLDIERHFDIKYGSAMGRWVTSPYLDDPLISLVSKGMLNYFKKEKELDLLMDIYEPANDTLSKRPLFLLIHGGAFYVGKKDDPTVVHFAISLARLGYVVASIDYRIGFRLKNDELERSGYKAVQDANAALRFLSKNSEKYKIDPNQVYVGGMSSGAITSLSLAFLDDNELPTSVLGNNPKNDLGKMDESGNKLSNTFEIKGIANMWGAVNDTNIIQADERIPVISFHGTDDNIVPYDYDFPFRNTLKMNRLLLDKLYGSKPIHTRLDNLKIPNKLITFQDAGHEPQLDYFRKFNSNLFIIESELTNFFSDLTRPHIEFDHKQKTIGFDSELNYYSIHVPNGELVKVEPIGGILSSAKNNVFGIIWFKEEKIHELEVIAKNEWGAWSVEKIKVNQQ